MRHATVQPADERVGVLFVNTKQRPPLGADTWVHLEIMRVLDRSRFDIHAACATGPADQPTDTYRHLQELSDLSIVPTDLGREMVGGTRWSKIRGALSLVSAAWHMIRLAVYIRRHRISVVHTADRPRDAAASVLLAKATGARSVVHMHVGYDAGWMQRMLRWSIFHADALIGVSSFVADTLLDAGCEPARVHVVLNGIDVERWEPGVGRDAVRAELALDDSTPVFMTVCRLFPSKGVTELVQALHDIGSRVPDAVLLVVGEEMVPGYVEELRSLARRLGVDARLHFLGRRSDVAAVMAAADVFAMPSFGEPFGLVYVEAMAMGLPVVALANAGALEIVEDGVTGLLSLPGDAAGLADNLAALLVDPARRSAFGDAGRRLAAARFTTERMAADAADVLAAVSSSAHRAHRRSAGDRAGDHGDLQ
jgi:glycosyltransferase involved in cell wall biosynthesis